MSSPSTPHDIDPRRNRLLRTLPAEELERMRPRMELVHFEIRDLVLEPNAPIEYLYFPTQGVLSQVAVIDDHTPVEVITIGREGMVGLPAFLGAPSSPNRVFCQVEADVLRLPAAELNGGLAADRALHRILRLYTQATMVQIAQSVACNQRHGVDQRACRWLLLTHDRVDSDTFTLTQDFLAQMLGVRRATVSQSAGRLQTAGMIRYSRGVITVLDRARLEGKSCVCYRIVQDQFDRLLPAD